MTATLGAGVVNGYLILQYAKLIFGLLPARRFPPPELLASKRGHSFGDPSRLSEDFTSETERPRPTCGGITDTDTLAEYKSASHGKFGQSTSASRIEDKTEQKRTAKFPFVRPFEPPAGSRQQGFALAQKTRLSWL